MTDGPHTPPPIEDPSCADDPDLAIAVKLALIAALDQRSTDPILDLAEQTAFVHALLAFVQAADRFAGVTQLHGEVHRRIARVLDLAATRLEALAVHPPAPPTGLSPAHAAQLATVQRQCQAAVRRAEATLLAHRWPAAEPCVLTVFGIQTATLPWPRDPSV